MASADVELNQQRSDSSLVSKSTQPHGSMDAVPLNNNSSEKHNDFTVKCNHFSIRGYVSEVRKRDPKLCYPFSLKDSTDPQSIELPPMVVPKFRWWRCISCVPEASIPCSAVYKEAQNPDQYADAQLPLVGQSSLVVVDVPRVRNAEASTSSDSNDNKNYSPLNVLADPKGKGKEKVHVEDMPSPSGALKSDFLKDSIQGIVQQTTGKIEVSLAAGNQAAELGSNGNGIIRALRQDSRVDDVEAEPAQEFVSRNVEYANAKCRVNPQASSEDRRADSPAKGIEAEVAVLFNGHSDDRKNRLINLPDLNECSGEPLYDDFNDAMITNSNNDVFSEDDDDYLGAERRKVPKVRFLSELLGLKETQMSTKGKKKNPSVTSSLDENVKRKRVGSLDEGSKSTEIRALDSGTKKTTGTTESSHTVSDSETDSDDVSMEIISKALAKRRCKSKIPLLEKRNSKSKFDNGSPSSMAQQKIMPRSAVHGKGKISENLPRRSYPDQLIERSSVLTKKRGKVLYAGKEAASFIPCKNRVPRDFAIVQKDVNAERSPVQNAKKASENGLHFPRSYVIKRNCQVRAPSGEDTLSLPSSQAEPMIVDGSNVQKYQGDRNHVAETSVNFRTTSVDTTFTGNPFDGNGERNIGPKTCSKEQKVGFPEVDMGSPLVQDMHLQMPNSAVNPKELTNQVRRRIHDIDINSIPIDEKVTEQGPADDIPMDIVELMAKNQYERHLGDPKETHNDPALPPISSRYIRDHRSNTSYGECWHKFGQPHFLGMQRPPSNDPRNCMVNGNFGHFSDFNHNPLNVANCLSRENPVSVRFSSPPQGQEHSASYPPPCGFPLSNWNGNINMAAAQRYPPRFLQAVESYRLGACPRQNTTDESRAWPSAVASRMPLGITNPQMISQSSNALNKGKIQHQTSGSILNFHSSATASLGKQQNLNFSNAYNVGGHPESSSGSVDMYTNDAISAMHLLSLMQNAAKMQNATLSLGPQKVMGSTSSRHPFTENNSRSSIVQDNSPHPCYPTAIPTARPFASSFQSNGANIGRNSNNTGFVGPIPLTLRGQRNIESSHFSFQSGDYRPQRRQMGSFLEKGKDISVTSHPSYVNPLQSMKNAAPKFLCGGGVRRDERTILPTPEIGICKLNQNPSEFNDLKELSRFMIGPDDLRPRGMARERSARPRADGKRQDVRLNKPIPSGKERERQRKS